MEKEAWYNMERRLEMVDESHLRVNILEPTNFETARVNQLMV